MTPFRFEAYQAKEDSHVDQLQGSIRQLTDDLIAFIASEISEPAPTRRNLLRNNNQLKIYLSHYDRLVSEGKILLTDERIYLPCGEAPTVVIDRLRARVQSGFDGDLLALRGIENLEPREANAMNTLPPEHLKAVLSSKNPLDFDAQWLEAFRALSIRQLAVIMNAFKEEGEDISKAGCVLLIAAAKIKDEVMELLNYSWHFHLKNRESAEVLEALSQLEIPLSILPIINFNSATAEEIMIMIQGMTPEKWSKIGEAYEKRKLEKGDNRVFSRPLCSIAQLREEQFGALDDIDSMFGYVTTKDAYRGDVFQDLAESNFPPVRIAEIGGRRLSVLRDLSESENNTSIVQELGRLTDEQIEAYGGLDHMLDIALGAPLTESERKTILIEIEQLLGIYEKQRATDDTTNYCEVLTLLREAIKGSEGLRIADSPDLQYALWQCSYQNLFIKRGSNVEPHRRLEAFCEALRPEARKLTDELSRARTNESEAVPLISLRDRSIMNSEGPNYLLSIPHGDEVFLIRSAVFKRFSEFLQQENTDEAIFLLCSKWPSSRDGLLSQINNLQSARLAEVGYYLEEFLNYDISDEFLGKILHETSRDGFIIWLMEEHYNWRELFKGEDIACLVTAFETEKEMERMRRWPKIEIPLD